MLEFKDIKDIPLTSKRVVTGIYTLQEDAKLLRIILRQGKELHGIRYDKSTKTWEEEWSQSIFDKNDDYPLDKYPWIVTDILLPDKEKVIIVKTLREMKYFRLNNYSGITVINSNYEFQYLINCMGYFYADKNKLGIMSVDELLNGETRFYRVTQESLMGTIGKPDFIVAAEAIDNDQVLLNVPKDTDILLTNFDGEFQSTIAIFNINGLELYKFDSDYIIKKVSSSIDITKHQIYDKISFGSITNKKYQDLLHLNTSGLHLYQYNDSNSQYKFLKRHLGFMKGNGWEPHYGDSIYLSDIDLNGFDDLLFTDARGLQAISYKIESNDWSQLTAGSQLFSNVIASVIPSKEFVSSPFLILQDLNGKIFSAEVATSNYIQTPVDKQITETLEPIEPILEGDTPVEIERQYPSTVPHLRWIEQFNQDFIKDPVNMETGTVRFTVPLIDVSAVTGWGLQWFMSYSSEGMKSDLLGNGWMFSPDPSYIILDYRGSIFMEDAKYYLVNNGNQVLLKYHSSKDNTVNYRLDGEIDENIKIQYDTEHESWMIDGDTEYVIYGTRSANNAWIQSPVWKYWRGIGRGPNDQYTIFIGWYACYRYDKLRQRRLQYFYNQDNTIIPGGRMYTTGIHLKTIKEENVEINFEYGSKTSIEYDKPDPQDEFGNIMFPIQMAQSEYLSEIEIKTLAYQQKFRFHYAISKSEGRFLRSVEQVFPDKGETILKFDYVKEFDKYLMKKCQILDKNIKLSLEYDTVTPPMSEIGEDGLVSREFPSIPNFWYGPGYIIASYEENGRLKFNIMNQKLTKTIITCDTENITCPLMEFSKIVNQKILTIQNAFAILIEGKDVSSIYMYKKVDANWIDSDTKEYLTHVSIQTDSQARIIIQNPTNSNVILFEPSNDSGTWSTKIIKMPIKPPITRFTANERLLLAYNDKELVLAYKDMKQVWRTKHLWNDVNLSFAKNLRSFEMNSKTKEAYIKQLNQNGLQIMNNLLLLTGIEVTGSYLASKLLIILLDKNYNVEKYQKEHKLRELIVDIKHDFYIRDPGLDRIRLGYLKTGKNFKAYVRSYVASSKIGHENDPKILNQLNKQFDEMLQNILLIDLKQYTAYAATNGVFWGDSAFLHYQNNAWKFDEVPERKPTPLGKYLSLKTDIKDPLNLEIWDNADNTNALHTIKLNSHGKLVTIFPAYIAYQAVNNDTIVLTFKDEKTLETIILLPDEMLLIESNLQNLLTWDNNSNQVKKRPVTTFVTPRSQIFVTKQKLETKDIQRETQYKKFYNTDPATGIYAHTAVMIPGGNKSKNGWYKIKQLFNLKTGDQATYEKWYNSKEEEVKFKKATSNVNKQIQQKSSTHTMLLRDITKRWLISDFSPYDLTEEMTGYYGFEIYENNKIGKKTKENSWKKYKAKTIINKFSLTGNTYLHLDHESSYLEGVFTPIDQTITYVAACWVRTDPIIKSSDNAVPYLKANIKTPKDHKLVGLLSKVKYQEGGWSYLELPINMNKMQAIYREYLKVNNQTITADEALTINLHVSPTNLTSLDIDHIRFHPISHDFEAIVYDSYTGQPTATIHNSGLISKTIYNRFRQQIANILQKNKIEQLTTTGIPKHNIKVKSIKHLPCKLTFKPLTGFYETFDRYSVLQHWDIDDVSKWNVTAGQLWHVGDKIDYIKAKPGHIDEESMAIRFYFTLQANVSSIQIKYNAIDVKLERQNEIKHLSIGDLNKINLTSTSGEVIVLFEPSSLFIWLDGILVVDKTMTTTTQELKFEFENESVIEDIFILNQPNVTIQYKNYLNEKTQTMHIVDGDHATVSEILYDELGRDAICTKKNYIERISKGPLLSYRSDYIDHRCPCDNKSVWEKGTMTGAINDLNPTDQGYPYTRVVYEDNPLNQPQKSGLPGIDFQTEGPHAVHYSRNINIRFIHIMFPIELGYTQKIRRMPNHTVYVQIFNERENQVAEYTMVSGHNDVLATYEYDEKNRLVKILPPEYHKKLDTFKKIDKLGSVTKSDEETKWQKILATEFRYNENGLLVYRRLPDTGVQHFLHNNYGKIRFIVQEALNERDQEVIYFNYDENGDVTSTGYLTAFVPIAELEMYVNNEILPLNRLYQKIDYSNDNRDPLLRGSMKQCITYGSNYHIIEKLQYDEQEQIISKETISDIRTDNSLTDMKKEFVGDRLTVLTYPNGLQLVHTYNKQGQLIGLGTSSNKYLYGMFSYTADGKLSEEHHKHFKRNYLYNSPGWLIRISDNFLIENLTYTEDGYGQQGFGDGIIMSSFYTPLWYEDVDGRAFQVRESDIQNDLSSKCLRSLELLGYLKENRQPVRVFIPSIEHKMPLVCKDVSDQLVKLFTMKLKASPYGYRYAYGHHQELIKAKYFSGKTFQPKNPFQPGSFTEIQGIDLNDSVKIWNSLADKRYINVDDTRFNSNFIQSHHSKQFFRKVDLFQALHTLHPAYTTYVEAIAKLFIDIISKRKNISVQEFVEIFIDWEGARENDITYNMVKENGQIIGNKLSEMKFLPKSIESLPAFLTNEFKETLGVHKSKSQEILRTIINYFDHELGQSPFDYESREMDANGNHKLFFMGSKRYGLEYHPGTNKVYKILMGSRYVNLNEKNETEPKNTEIHEMEHDIYGNVVKAMHKNLQRIVYHPVSQRTTSIFLSDETKIYFYYDTRGERILKRVFLKGKDLSHETYYVRDEQGRVLTDRVTKYLPSPMEIVTDYIYGPRGLAGFIRNKEFYNVFADHLGSIRLVIKDDKVVAAYDYLPYGESMRKFDANPFVRISYRFSGQEFDEETGLYNFHARLYDPTIGRFYQPDPRGQFFSPYKYAGNSPATLTDPNGELVFLLIAVAVGALVGAYLSGAATNDRWNPADWDWSSSNTWISIAAGAIGGALMPVAVAGSIASLGGLGLAVSIGFGLGGAYVMGAASQGVFNPFEWAWDRPAVWNSMFQGFGIGSGSVSGVMGIHQFAARFSSFGKTLFLTTSYGSGGGLAYISGANANKWNWAFWEWNAADPETYASLLDGFYLGLGIPQALTKIGIGTGKIIRQPKRILSLGRSLTRDAVKQVLKNPKNPLYQAVGAAVLSYFMGASAAEELDITKWDLSSFSTYEGISNGMFMGRKTFSLLKLGHTSRNKVHSQKRKRHHNKILREGIDEGKEIVNDAFEMFGVAEYQMLMEQFFNRNEQILAELKAKGFSNQIQEFLNSGKDNYLANPLKIPKELKIFLDDQINKNANKFLQKFNDWSIDNKQTTLEKSTTIFESNNDYINCDQSIDGCVLVNKVSDNVLTDFIENPEMFIENHVINMRELTINKIEAAYQDGSIPVYKFDLKRGNHGFILLPASSIATGSNIIEASFLGPRTAEANIKWDNELTIPANSKIKFIFVPECKECTIGAKITADTLKLRLLKNSDPINEVINEYQLYEGEDRYLTKHQEYVSVNDESVQSNEIYYKYQAKHTIGTVIYQDSDGWKILYQKHNSYYVKDHETEGIRYDLDLNGLQGRTIAKISDSRNNYGDSQTLIEKVLINNKQTVVESINQNQPPPSSKAMPSVRSPTFTNWHFNGALQLLDVGIKKLTGQKYFNSSVESVLDWKEACIEATKIVNQFQMEIENAAKALGIQFDLFSFDSYELYQKVVQKLLSNDINGVQKLLEDAVQDALHEISNDVDNSQITEFSKKLNDLVVHTIENIIKINH